MKRFLTILLLFISFFLFGQKAIAANNFSTDYNVSYNIKPSSDTAVTLDVSLTNLSENYYASSYDIEVGFTDIRSLRASDEQGSISPSLEKTNNGSLIHVPFNQKVTGKGNKLNFKVLFDTGEIAQNLGNVWDVNIPGISKKSDFSNFKVTVSYPPTLGKPTFIKPKIDHAIEGAENTISFTREDLGESGISLAFGSFQVYNFDLIYHLQNTNLFNVKTEIALPPTTNYQDVYFSKISPKPTNVYKDGDGNWLAEYKLGSSQKLDVKVVGQVKVSLNPKQEKLSPQQMETYLKETSYWESKNPKIKDLANRLKTPKEIYNFVAKHLNYDFSRVETQSPRLGALGALEKPTSAVCLEFMDLFIAISRAAGIPTRAVNGYAYTDNSKQRPLSFIKDILHAWPEYYDFEKSTWVMVDPTWGNTTKGVDYFDVLDFDHFTFVKNGINSSYPIPAGGYKYSGNLNEKDVNVSITSNFKPISQNLSGNLNIATNHIAGFPIKGRIVVENDSGTLSKEQVMYIYSNKLDPPYQSINIPSLVPFEKKVLSFNFNKTDILTNEVDTIRISLDGKSSYKNIYISPFFLDKWFLLGGILVVLLITTIPIAYTGLRRIHLLRQQRRDNLRRESDKHTQEGF